MYLRRLLDLGPAILIPMVLGICLVCVVAGFFVVITTPEGLDPIEGFGLRLYLLRYNDELNRPIGVDPTPLRFEIVAGESANDIGIKLVTQGVISNGSLFARYAQFEGRDDDLRPGIFFLNKTMTIPDILDVLTDPTPSIILLLIRENMRLEQVGEAIDNNPRLEFNGDEFLTLVQAGATIPEEFRLKYGIPQGASLEGFLYPATYEIELGSTAIEFRDMLLNAFEQAVTQELIDEATRQGRTIYQIVTMAAIVELESILEDERPIIASVYWNRIAAGEKLQADPTVQYQLANNRQDGIWWPQITQSDYTNTQGPYNTYINFGLPPGPIVSPGLRSIRAALYPAQTNYRYFQVSCDGGGKHEFFTDYTDHEAYFTRRLNGCQ